MVAPLTTPAAEALDLVPLLAASQAAVTADADFRNALDGLHDELLKVTRQLHGPAHPGPFFRDLQGELRALADRLPNHLTLGLLHDTIVAAHAQIYPENTTNKETHERT